MTSLGPNFMQCRQSGIHRRSGFTLLEILVAMSIISIALIAVFQLYAQTISMNHQLAFNTQAPFLAQQKLNQLMMMPAEEMGDDSGDFGDDFTGYSWVAAVEDLPLESLESQTLKQITIQISMSESGQTYRLKSYRFPRD
jgi:general secretion pathway protein I